MTTAADIAADPAWLPHAFDPQRREVAFLRIERDRLSAPAFLADRQPATPADLVHLPAGDVAAMRSATGPLAFIFHTAFCRSTLLVRALDIPGTSAGLSEPGILASLVNAGEAGAALVKPVLDLLSRPQGPGEAVFVKPTNHANRLVPAILAARPDANAILMTNRLAPFLHAVARRGLMGRRWARQLFLELQTYAGMDFGMDPRESFSATDLQCAGLAWFLNQRFFAALLRQHGPDRLKLLDGDSFNANRAGTLSAAQALVGRTLSDPDASASSAVFASHAKLGGDFGATEEEGRAKTASPVTAEEVAQVEQWVGMIAQQAGLKLPLPETLLATS